MMLPLPLWSETELAYLAGILDGEGSFTLGSTVSKRRFVTVVQVGNTDIRLLKWIEKRFGGTVSLDRRHNRQHKDMWRWYAHANTLEAILRGVLPYLVIKRDRAEILLAYRETLGPIVRKGRTPHEIPDELMARRRELRAQILALNRRGA